MAGIVLTMEREMGMFSSDEQPAEELSLNDARVKRYAEEGASVHWTNRPLSESALWELADTLRAMHDELEDYSFINHLGGYDNHNMRRARAILKKVGFQFAADRSAVKEGVRPHSGLSKEDTGASCQQVPIASRP